MSDKELTVTDSYSGLTLPNGVDIQKIFDNAREKFKRISREPTPPNYVSDLDGKEYVKRHYMRNKLNEHYPIWNFEILDWKVVGIPKHEWIIVHVRLIWIDDSGAVRHCDMLDGHRVQHLTEMVNPNTKEKRKLDDFLNIGNDAKAAVTDAFKKVTNFATGIADDIYRFIEEELAPEYEQLLRRMAIISDNQGALKALDSGIIDMKNIKSSLRKVLDAMSDEQFNEISEQEQILIETILGVKYFETRN